MRRQRAMVCRSCEQCGAPFETPVCEVKRGLGRFCSRSCAATAHLAVRHRVQPQVGPANPRWAGGRSRDRYAYKLIQKARYPEREAARRLVYEEVRKGRLVRPTACESCHQTGRVEAHHADYGKPLDVQWWCVACHRQHHRTAA